MSIFCSSVFYGERPPGGASGKELHLSMQAMKEIQVGFLGLGKSPGQRHGNLL